MFESMAQLYNCHKCDEKFPVNAIFSHMEKAHVGPRASSGLYDISCGLCDFEVCERNETDMIEHCFKSGHAVSECKLNWDGFLKRETRRVLRALASGAELLKKNSEEFRDVHLTEERSVFSSTRINFGPPAEKDEFWNNPQPTPKTILLDLGDTNLDLHRREKPTEMALNIVESSKCKGQTSPSTAIARKADSEQRIASQTSFQENLGEHLASNDEKTATIPNYTRQDLSQDISQLLSTVGNAELTTEKSQRSEKLRKHNASICRAAGSVIECNVCHRIIQWKKTAKAPLLSHGLRHTGLKLIQCSECQKKFYSKYEFVTHNNQDSCRGNSTSLKSVGDVLVLRTQLKRCFPSVDFDSDLSPSASFFQSSSNSINASATGSGKPVKGILRECQLCVNYSARRRTTAITHILSHCGLKLFECDNCQQRCSEPHAIKSHSKRFLSKGCDGSFSIKATPNDKERVQRLLSQGFPTIDWKSNPPVAFAEILC